MENTAVLNVRISEQLKQKLEQLAKEKNETKQGDKTMAKKDRRRLSLYVDEAQYQDLRTISVIHDLSMAKILRLLLRNYLHDLNKDLINLKRKP